MYHLLGRRRCRIHILESPDTYSAWDRYDESVDTMESALVESSIDGRVGSAIRMSQRISLSVLN